MELSVDLGSDPATQLWAGATFPMHHLPCSLRTLWQLWPLSTPPLSWPQLLSSQICPAHSSCGWMDGWFQNSCWRPPPESSSKCQQASVSLLCLAQHYMWGTYRAQSRCPPGVGVPMGMGQGQVRLHLTGNTVQLSGLRLGSEEAAGTKMC